MFLHKDLTKFLLVCVVLLWVAPEVLRLAEGRSYQFAAYGSREADVYSFGVIMQEIATSDEPYFAYDINLEGLSLYFVVTFNQLKSLYDS